MRGQPGRPGDRGGELAGTPGEGGEDIGVEDDGATGRQRGANQLAGGPVGTEPWAEKNGVAPFGGEQAGEIRGTADRQDYDPGKRCGKGRLARLQRGAANS